MPVPIVFRVNSSLALKHAAMDGLGIAQFPAFDVGDALREGRLVRVLDERSAMKSTRRSIEPLRAPPTPRGGRT